MAVEVEGLGFEVAVEATVEVQTLKGVELAIDIEAIKVCWSDDWSWSTCRNWVIVVG